MESTPFTIRIPDDTLADLHERLDRVRWPDEVPGAGWQYGADLTYLDPETSERYVPHVLEPTFGLDRHVLAVMTAAYHEASRGVMSDSQHHGSHAALDVSER